MNIQIFSKYQICLTSFLTIKNRNFSPSLRQCQINFESNGIKARWIWWYIWCTSDKRQTQQNPLAFRQLYTSVHGVITHNTWTLQQYRPKNHIYTLRSHGCLIHKNCFLDSKKCLDKQMERFCRNMLHLIPVLPMTLQTNILCLWRSASFCPIACLPITQIWELESREIRYFA